MPQNKPRYSQTFIKSFSNSLCDRYTYYITVHLCAALRECDGNLEQFIEQHYGWLDRFC
ncbi:hypothetical protein PQG02_00345 (plasmid) [Nostoc sp. UHCC 0926]|nr:hypothetical protein PQG02_00345 [Nostoc sp. UHCC 0926]